MSDVLAKHVAQVLAAFGAIGIPQTQQSTCTKFEAEGSVAPIACGPSIAVVLFNCNSLDENGTTGLYCNTKEKIVVGVGP